MSDTLLDAMIAAALEAGRVAHAHYLTPIAVRRKADASPVTDADLAAEAVIVAHLARVRPDVPVVAEEAVARGQVPEPGETCFLVDPLDGTKEFIERRGDFTVNIALVAHGRPVLGVVYAPARALLYAGDVPAGLAVRSAERPDGDATSPPEPIQVRPLPADGPTAVASRSHAGPETADYLERCGAGRTVSVGSSLKFCLVAEGAADVYPRLGPTMEWDTAAGHAVLLAAGGTVRVASGGPLSYGKPGFRNPCFVAAAYDAPLPPDDKAP